MQNKIFALTTLVASTVTLAQELPNPNPAPQADGTQIWYVGNNTQYPVIQDVLAACSDGDEIVVNGETGTDTALYVESLMIDNKDMLTLRPRVRHVTVAGGAGYMEFDNVAFLNPTQGFNNDNKYAIHISGSRGSYIGNPRSVNELLNGQEAVVVLDDQAAFSEAAAPGATTRIAQGSDVAFTFQARSFDDVSILLDGSSCTVSDCALEPRQGVGGGLMSYNGDNSTMVECTIVGFTSTGNTHDISGLPVCAVSMKDSSTTMASCTITGNFGANSGIVNLDGGAPRFEKTLIASNNAQASLGTVMGSGGSAEFMSCSFGKQTDPAVAGGGTGNVSNLGTIYWDASASTGMYAFTHCDFDRNTTAEASQGWGEIAYVSDSTATGSDLDPKISFSACEYVTDVTDDGPYGTMDSSNGIPEESAIYTPYLPEYRLHSDWGDSTDWGLGGGPASGLSVVDNSGSNIPGDVDGNDAVNFADLDVLMSLLGTCQYDPTRDGEVGFADVLSILNSWGEICE